MDKLKRIAKIKPVDPVSAKKIANALNKENYELGISGEDTDQEIIVLEKMKVGNSNV